MSRNVWHALGEAGERHVRGRIDEIGLGPRRLRQNAAQTLAGRLVGVIVEAYDDEGAVIWVKSQWRPV